MNVNPFSYLIEKLKGKVSKSGDTMTGDLVIDKADSTLSLRASGSKYTHLKSSATGSDKTVTFPNASGTIALTSDIPVIHAGRYDAGTIPTNTEQTYTITFPYTNNPICSLLLEVPYGYGGQLIYHIQRYGNTSMTVDIKNNANVGLGILFHWIVVEAQ